MKTNLVALACKKASTHPSEIFRVACLHHHKNWNMLQTRNEYKEATGLDMWPDFVLDTALDILAGRILLWVDLGAELGGEVWIVKPDVHLLPSERWKKGTNFDWQEEQW